MSNNEWGFNVKENTRMGVRFSKLDGTPMYLEYLENVPKPIGGGSETRCVFPRKERSLVHSGSMQNKAVEKDFLATKPGFF